MIGQHMGRASDGGMPAELKPYCDSLVYTYRVEPFNAVLLTSSSRSSTASWPRGATMQICCVCY